MTQPTIPARAYGGHLPGDDDECLACSQRRRRRWPCPVAQGVEHAWSVAVADEPLLVTMLQQRHEHEPRPGESTHMLMVRLLMRQTPPDYRHRVVMTQGGGIQIHHPESCSPDLASCAYALAAQHQPFVLPKDVLFHIGLINGRLILGDPEVPAEVAPDEDYAYFANQDDAS